MALAEPYTFGMIKQKLTLLTEARKAVRTGEAIELRLAAELSQGELARAVGVNAATVSRWEAGLRKPSGEAALRYARGLRLLRGSP